MNIWILTLGSSDVQLKTKANWTKLFREVRSQLDGRGFNPGLEMEGRFQVPARVMGVVYSQPQAEQHFEDLVFPLLDNFTTQLEEQLIEIDQVILVLSDQSVFTKSERSSQFHPYWQDTCTLRPLLEKYLLQKLKSSSLNLTIEQPLYLKPTVTTEGLDNWNSVLTLVQNQFRDLTIAGNNFSILDSHGKYISGI